MKYVLLVGDGMADVPLKQLDNKTPLRAVAGKSMARLASRGRLGLARTVPDGIEPGTDTAFYTILGYDVKTQFTGRSPMEAAGMGISLIDGEVAFRCNLAAITPGSFDDAQMISHAGGQIGAQDGADLMHALMQQPPIQALCKQLGLIVHIGTGFRHILSARGPFADALDAQPSHYTPPHDIVGKGTRAYLPSGGPGERFIELMRLSYEYLNTHPINLERVKNGKAAANCLWPWGQGTRPALAPIKDNLGVKRGAVISAVPLVQGLGAMIGLEVIHVDGATGELDTNYDGKADATVQALKDGADFALLHVEAPDECSHAGDLDGKMESIRRVDAMLGRVMEALEDAELEHRILLLSDHATLSTTRTHDSAPIPFALYDSRESYGQERLYDELSAQQTGFFLEDGRDMIRLLLERISI